MNGALDKTGRFVVRKIRRVSVRFDHRKNRKHPDITSLYSSPVIWFSILEAQYFGIASLKYQKKRSGETSEVLISQKIAGWVV